MDNEIKSEKFRRLSIIALLTAVLAIIFIGISNFIWVPIADLLYHFNQGGVMSYIIPSFFGIAFSLAITSVICGSIDLKRIRAGIYSKKGKGLDIAGIVFVGFFILVAGFLMGEMFMPANYF